jgi:nucleotide-binding universal stress UspA family protein
MKILLAVDGSKYSEAATQAVIAQAKPGYAEVRVLHVVDVLRNQLPETRAYYPEIEHDRDAQRKPAEALVGKTAELLLSKGLETTTVVELGNPKSVIIETAQTWGADLIVVGSHGRKGLIHFLMGSVSETVARHAGCSVEIVRIPSKP